MTPYYDDGLVTIYQGRSEDVLPTLPPADLIMFSPPYNLGVGDGFGHWSDGAKSGRGGATTGSGKWTGVTSDGIDYADHHDAMPMPAYEAWQRRIITACWERLSDVGAIFYNHKPRPMRSLWHPRCLIPDHLPVRQEIIWWRKSGINFSPTHYVPTYEVVIVIARDDWRLKSRGASGVGDVWAIPPDAGNEHPAPFPVALPARVIETTAPELVIDPFMGSGSTLRAAKDAGVRAIGVDRSERYCEMAARRLAQGSLFGAAT